MAGFSAVFLLGVSLLLGQATSRAVNISTTWTLPQEGFPHFFRYFKDPTTWDDAKVICKSFHAELLTVENDQRRDAARAYLKELDVLENVWCGLERSAIEAPFVWTGGGQDALIDDAFWQEPHPLEPERLCVSITPLHDFRWQSFPCSGPQQSSFVCQLEVPKWAEKCLVSSLPSLTVTFLPEPGVIELLSDCGLSGTKRIACKGAENEEDLMKRLSCEPEEEASTIYTTIRSSNTRHKRESGATSTSTDTTIFATEPEIKIERIPAPEPMSPVDAITIIAEYAKEDQIEDTTVSVIDQTKQDTFQSSTTTSSSVATSTIMDATSKLTVKNWLAALNDESTTTEPSTTTQVPSTQTKMETPQTTFEATTTTTTTKIATEKESHMPHAPFIQFRDKQTTKLTTTEKPTTEEIELNTTEKAIELELSTEMIPAETSDTVPEMTARPATINASIESTEPKNTITETLTSTGEPKMKINTEISPSDENSQEAENPKRSTRGRLFPHSNPLSFYPYFLNKVLG